MYTKVKDNGDEYMDFVRVKNNALGLVGRAARYIAVPMLVVLLASRFADAASSSLVSELNGIQLVLTQVGPALSAVLFVLAGIFYAIGQMLPPEKKANFHTAAVNMIIGAIVVGVLSVAATSLAIASTHLIGNVIATNLTG